MATWRFTANYVTPTMVGEMTIVTKPHPCLASAESDAITALEAFYGWAKRAPSSTARGYPWRQVPQLSTSWSLTARRFWIR